MLGGNFGVFQITITLRMDDKMNRQLTCEITEEDTSVGLAAELVHHGFISSVSTTACALQVA